MGNRFNPNKNLWKIDASKKYFSNIKIFLKNTLYFGWVLLYLGV